MWRTSRRACILCPWTTHLTACNRQKTLMKHKLLGIRTVIHKYYVNGLVAGIFSLVNQNILPANKARLFCFEL